MKCFYCDGGLRNWQPEDAPWVEHARWVLTNLLASNFYITVPGGFQSVSLFDLSREMNSSPNALLSDHQKRLKDDIFKVGGFPDPFSSQLFRW